MAPQWLNPDSLQKFLDDEQKDEAFSALPFQWLEFATSLLERFQPSFPRDTCARESILIVVRATISWNQN